MRSPASSPGPAAWLLTSGALGAGFGSLEGLLRVLASGTPSVLRRAPGLIATAGLLYGILAAAAGTVLYVAGRRRFREAGAAALDAVTATLLGAGILAPMGLHLFRTLVPSKPRALTWIAVAMMGAAFMAALAVLLAILLRTASSARAGRVLGAMRRGLVAAGAGLFVLSLLVSLVTGGPTGLALSTPGPLAEPSGGAAEQPNILVILVDTLRADHLSAYGSRRAPTPNVDALAARGVLFENAYAPCSWTTPSVASLLTSRYPTEHGVTDFHSRAPRALANLPGLLADRGYATAAVVSNPLLGHADGYDRGYGLYDIYPGEIERSLTVVSAANGLTRALVRLPLHTRVRLYPRLGLAYPPRFRVDLSDYVRGDEITDLALDVVDGLPEGPFFLYLHYAEPHTPYLSHPFGFLPGAIHLKEGRVEEVIERYNGEVAYMDGQLGRLLEGLRERGLLESTIVAFVSDHGEEFMEHGVWEHGHNLHEQSLRVPIILAGPGVPAGERRPEPADLLDVAPTLLALVGAPPGRGFQGRDLLASEGGGEARGGERPRLTAGPGDGAGATDRPLFSQLWLPRMSRTDQVSVLAEGWRYVRHRDQEGALVREELFDRSLDPEEMNDLSAERPERLEAMRAIVADLEARLVESADSLEAGESDEGREKRLERLRSLGYVD